MRRMLSLISACVLWFSVERARGAQAQTSSPDSSKGLTQAVLAQDFARVQAALEQGADPNSRDEQGTPVLSLAVSRTSTEIVRALLSKGADIHAKAKSPEDVNGTPVIWNAAANGTGEIVRILLQAGADPNARGVQGFTPLMGAALLGNTATLEVLIAAKVDLEARGDSDDTALMAAANWGQYEATRLLLDAGAKINALGELKATPLMYAAQHGFDDVVALLIERGADTTIKATPSLTALDLAKQNGHETTVRLLENGGRQTPPEVNFEKVRELLYPGTPFEQIHLNVQVEQEALDMARQKILAGELQQAREMMDAERERLKEILAYWWTLFYAQQQLGDRPAALGSLRYILARPDLGSREALRAWKLMRDLGENPPPEVSKQVLGVVVEIGIGPVIAIVAAFADGQPRLFISSGIRLFGDDWEEAEIQSSREVVRLAQDLLEGMSPGQDQAPPLPKPGRVHFHLLTPGGSYTAEDSDALMKKGEGRYVQLYVATHELFKVLRQRYDILRQRYDKEEDVKSEKSAQPPS